jgi:hypothetical protein
MGGQGGERERASERASELAKRDSERESTRVRACEPASQRERKHVCVRVFFAPQSVTFNF